MKRGQKLLSVLLTLCVFFTLCPAEATEMAQLLKYTASGSWTVGESELFWLLDEDGELTIEGTGSMLEEAEPGSDDPRMAAIMSPNISASFADSGSYPWNLNANGGLSSSNQGRSSTSSTTTITFLCNSPLRLMFSWSVSSESYDPLTITLDESNIVNTGGSNSGTVDRVLAVGSHTLQLNYRKDSSNNYGSDTATVSELRILSEPWYDYREQIHNAVIPSGITDIMFSAFYGCSALTEVTIPNSVTSIGDFAFYGCTSLTGVTIPNNVSSIGNSAFSGCTGLTGVTIPGSVNSIGDSAFSGCTSLTEVTIPTSINSIGASTFSGCTKLTSVTIPSSVSAIGTSAFSSCPDITLHVPNGSYAQSYARRNNIRHVILGAEQTVYTASGSWTVGESELFWLLDEDGELTIEGTGSMLEEAEPGSDDPRMAAIMSPNISASFADSGSYPWNLNANGGLSSSNQGRSSTSSTTTITFLCNSPLRLMFSWSVSSESYDPLTITLDESNIVNTGGSNSGTVDRVLAVGSHTLQLNYRKDSSNNYGSDTATVSELRILSEPWYDYREQIHNAVIPSGITDIMFSAFYGCSALTEVTIPNSVTSIGDFAFYGCTSLTGVTIPNNVSSIGNSAFSGCTGLTGVTIPGSVNSIGDSAFSGCTSLTAVTIPSGVSSIGDSVFSGCTALTEYVVADGTTSLSDNMFRGCTNLTSVTVPASVTNIGEGTFSDCPNITLYVSAGSTARSYAIRNNIPFEISIADADATGVEVSPTTVTLEVGDTAQLTATVQPFNAKDKSVTWTSLSSGVASVDENGLVTAVSPGEVRIMATSTDGGFTAFCKVTVNAPTPVSGVTLDKSLIVLDVNGTESLTATVAPDDASNKAVTWTSSDSSIVAVDESGTVTMKARGAAVVTVTTADGGKTASCTVTTPVDPTGLKLDKTSLVLAPGVSASISASVIPENATSRVVRWTSADPDIASVDAEGVVTALKEGSATIVATCAVGGAYAVCLVTVQGSVTHVASVTVAPSKVDSLSVGSSVTLSATISPANASNRDMTWSSDRPEVADVSAKGTVTARSAGTAVITATTSDGGKTASCTVTVPASERVPDRLEATLPGAVEIIKGSPLNVPGLTVYAVYGTEKETVKDYALSGYDADKTGAQTITVTYREKTTTFQVTVVDRAVESLSVVQQPAKREYAVGETLSLSGLTLSAVYNDKTSQEITDTSKFSASGFDSSRAGSCTVTVSYGGKSADFTVTVREASPSVTVSAPSINIVSFAGGKRVELSSAQGAQIRYTTDGSDPVSGGTAYAAPLELTETKTVKAVALLNGNASSVTSGRVSVTKAGTPSASYASGAQLPAGTLVTLRTDTQGANIYYTTNGDAPSVKSALYGSGVLVNADTTIQAIAVKEGCANSDILTLTYSVPRSGEETRSGAVISFGSVTSRAGQAVAVPVYIFADEAVTEFRFTVKYDAGIAGRSFEYASVSPVEGMRKSSLLVSDDAASGELTVYYQGGGIESGEMFTLNLNVLASAEDDAYPLTLSSDGISVQTGSVTPLVDVTEGVITLQGSHNSQLTGSVTFSSGGTEISSGSAIPSGTSKVSATFDMDPYQPEQGASVMVNVFAAVYDRDGFMVDLEMWETLLSNAGSVFMRDIDIPPNVQVGRIKIMILSDDLTPLMAQSAL